MNKYFLYDFRSTGSIVYVFFAGGNGTPIRKHRGKLPGQSPENEKYKNFEKFSQTGGRAAGGDDDDDDVLKHTQSSAKIKKNTLFLYILLYYIYFHFILKVYNRSYFQTTKMLYSNIIVFSCIVLINTISAFRIIPNHRFNTRLLMTTTESTEILFKSIRDQINSSLTAKAASGKAPSKFIEIVRGMVVKPSKLPLCLILVY